ncbi:hypothetical protein EYF80_033250 [Liparis tanakae]|uniref:Uncharacterized protein n=1 Tax=Liparis tanakae TaxID=230148 RepID=A0A4Z2GV87_9TELE|nr:hypothetical protein EYF80_033250 [Liparis tanakae]
MPKVTSDLLMLEPSILTMTNTEMPADERKRRKEGGMRRLRGEKRKREKVSHTLIVDLQKAAGPKGRNDTLLSAQPGMVMVTRSGFELVHSLLRNGQLQGRGEGRSVHVPRSATGSHKNSWAQSKS